MEWDNIWVILGEDNRLEDTSTCFFLKLLSSERRLTVKWNRQLREKIISTSQLYVWYVGYGSNLSKQRFLCYIVGGTPKYGKKYYDGCSNTDCPIEDKPFRIPYRLYFALPGIETKTGNWGQGGVAFINPKKEGSEDNWSWCRMWKITCEQYEEVRVQEGKWYNHGIFLGEKNGIPIRTVTNKEILSNIIPPSEAYLKTIALGLKETYNFTYNEIAAYLIGKEGIKGKFSKDKLIRIIESASSKI